MSMPERERDRDRERCEQAHKFSVVYAALNVNVCLKSKKISNDQELIQSDPKSCPQNQKGNNVIHKLTAFYERHAR